MADPFLELNELDLKAPELLLIVLLGEGVLFRRHMPALR
jgi:hypothetical protein